MKIEYIKGNLLDTLETYLMHGCNAQGAMNSGVAKQIRETFPQAYTSYRSAFTAGKLKLGFVQFVNTPSGHVIINAVTQQDYGRDPNVQYVDYDAVRQVFSTINKEAEKDINIRQIALPKIGAGLGNGDWAVISKIIEQESKSFQPVVYEQ